MELPGAETAGVLRDVDVKSNDRVAGANTGDAASNEDANASAVLEGTAGAAVERAPNAVAPAAAAAAAGGATAAGA